MNENIKKMCLELAEKALTTDGVTVTTNDYIVSVFHHVGENRDVMWYKNIHFTIESLDHEKDLTEALDYIDALRLKQFKVS